MEQQSQIVCQRQVPFLLLVLLDGLVRVHGLHQDVKDKVLLKIILPLDVD